MIALPIFEALGPSHRLHLISDYRNTPILRVGDFAVIDQNDTEPVDGALYVAGVSEPRVWECGLERPGEIWLRPLNRPRSADEALTWLHAGILGAGMSDGPYRPDYWPCACHGRVVGLFQSEFDETQLVDAGSGSA